MSSSFSRENKTGYDLWSQFYDSYPNPTVALDDLTFPQCYSHLQNQNILEVGCGTGRHTVRLLEAKNKVTGIDISEGMLAQLKRKITNPDLVLLQGDFVIAEIPGSPFDALVTSLVLEHIPDLKSFFASAGKILKVGGKIYISEIHPSRTADGVFAHFKTVDGDEVHLKSSPHRSEDFINAAIESGFMLQEERSVVGSQALAELNSKWIKHLDQPLLQIWIFKKI